MNLKVFAQRFNREIMLLGFPEDVTEKGKAIAKVFGVSRHLANAMIFGYTSPSSDQINKIAQILDVDPHWLIGKADKKKAYVHRETEPAETVS
ncbi:MAG: helix-turn-helix transcriptional regulator [Legionella sp.]|nr:helix-turn-helix transcriptional regulator [Legionella sp.]